MNQNSGRPGERGNGKERKGEGKEKDCDGEGEKRR